MLVVISPAKKLNESPLGLDIDVTQPQLLSKTNEAVSTLKKLNQKQISNLMKLSEKLSDLNFKRFQSFSKPSITKPAIFMFDGDTYTGLDINSLKNKDIKKTQKNVRILSGLYGILRPLDIIAPYRLEMGTSISIGKYKNLYSLWREEVTNLLNQDLKNHNFLANLASNEYFKVVDTKNLSKPIIQFNFLDKKNDQYKMISFNAKRARGAMAREIVLGNVSTLDDLKHLTPLGYTYSHKDSSELELTYLRD